MNLMLVSLLALCVVLALTAMAFPVERDKLVGGVRALKQTFGMPFVLALAGVSALLVGACWYQHGWLAALAAGALILLAIRAHDLGAELAEYEANNELDAAYDARPASLTGLSSSGVNYGSAIGTDYDRAHRTQPSYGSPEL